MTKFYAQEKQVFDINKVTIVGSPTITSDGVASNLSQAGYFTAPFIDFKDKAFSFKARVKFTDFTGSRNVIFGQQGRDLILPSLCLEGNKLRIYRPTNGTTYDSWNVTTFTPQINTWYDIELIMDLSNIIVKINGDEVVKKASSGITFDIGSNVVCLGTSLNLAGWKLDGSIDLTAFKIYVDNELVYSPTKPVYSLERRKPMVWDKEQFTVVGSPVISDSGWASGFSSGNQISKQINISTDKNVVFKGKGVIGGTAGAQRIFDTNATRTTSNTALLCLVFDLSAKKVYFDCYKNNSFTRILNESLNFNNGSIVEYEVTISLNTQKYKIIVDGIETNFTSSVELTTLEITNCYASSPSQYYWQGSIDLKSFKIYTDNNLVFDGGRDRYLYDSSKFTVVGSPTITEAGVASGFSVSNYLKTPNIININSNNFKIITLIDSGSSPTSPTNQTIWSIGEDGQRITLNFNQGVFNLASGYVQFAGITQTIALTPNTVYKLIVEVDGVNASLSIFDVNNNLLIKKSTPLNSTYSIGNHCFMGRSSLSGANPLTGSIDLTQFSITVDGKEVFTGAKEKFYAMRGN